MTPRTRSGGAAPPSSIAYKSTPTLKQVQFPARRRRVRTYGRQNRRSGGRGDDDDDKENHQGSSAHPTPNLKQKTLTQYDFASSFKEEDVVELSDASDVEDLDKVEDTDEEEAEKENNVPKGTKRRRSPGAKLAPLQPLEYMEQEEEEGEEQGEEKKKKEEEEEESRVLDTEEEDEEDEEPVARGRRGVEFTHTAKTKRRRTLGEEHRRSTMKESKSSRRRTLGDSPIAGPSRNRHHTQTLTQFIGRTTSFIADSDDEELNDVVEDGGFLEWLGTEEPQSPTMGTQASKRSTAAESTSAAAAAPQVWEDHSPSPRRRTRRRQVTQISQQQPREESVVPQTPIKSIRFDLPPSAQHISPSPTRIAAVYGAPDSYLSPSLGSQRRKQNSPVKPILELTGMPTKRVSPAKKPELVIEDSYATEGWSSVGGTQARHSMPSQTQTHVFSTPVEESAPQAAAAASASIQVGTSAENDEEAGPAPLQTQSQAGQVEGRFYGAVSQIVPATSQQPLPTTPEPARQSPPAEEDVAAAATEEREIPDSDDESDDFGAENDATDDEAEESRFAAGAETQLLMDQLQSSVRKWRGTPRAGNAASSSSAAAASPRLPRTSSPSPSPGTVVTPESAPPSSLKPAATGKPPPKRPPPQPTLSHDIPTTAHSTPLRRPLHHPEPVDTQGVPFESQRVALATLQGFTPASARTDILLPLSHGTLANLLSGHQDAVVLPFKIPAQVVRFWILHDGVLRYLACVAATDGSSSGGGGGDFDPHRDNGCGGRGVWSYRVAQVYELNNPAQEDDMRAEDWIHGPIRRYVYFPPAVVSQLLWNLRQALFADPADAVISTTPRTAAAAALASSSPLRRSSRLSTPARSRQQQQQQASSPLRYARPPPSTMPAPPAPVRPARACKQHHTQPAYVRPSQATTASQASTVDIPASPCVAAAAPDAAGVVPRRAADGSSESLVFDDHGGSSIMMPYSGVSGLDGSLAASQLLTGSQILPESLVRDEEQERGAPEEIWDSEEEEEE
ncbi:hypothetical protein MY11210_008864 [Beauveria gryllotalpidicola]